jgi:hypothetical protein
MAIKKLQIGSLRKLHRHIGEVLAELDGGAAPATDIDLASAERGGVKPTVDAALKRPMHEAIPGFNRLGGSL